MSVLIKTVYSNIYTDLNEFYDQTKNLYGLTQEQLKDMFATIHKTLENIKADYSKGSISYYFENDSYDYIKFYIDFLRRRGFKVEWKAVKELQTYDNPEVKDEIVIKWGVREE